MMNLKGGGKISVCFDLNLSYLFLILWRYLVQKSWKITEISHILESKLCEHLNFFFSNRGLILSKKDQINWILTKWALILESCWISKGNHRFHVVQRMIYFLKKLFSALNWLNKPGKGQLFSNLHLISSVFLPPKIKNPSFFLIWKLKSFFHF